MKITLVLDSAIKKGITYAFIGILRSGVSFLILPLYTLHMTTSEYGEYSLLLSSTSLVAMVVVGPIRAGLTRYFYQFVNKTRLISSVFGYVIIVTILLFILLLAFKRMLIDNTSINGGILYDVFLFIILLMPLASLLNKIGENFQEPERLLRISIVNTIFTQTVTIIALVWLDLGPVAIALGFLLQQFIQMTYLGYIYRNFIRVNEVSFNIIIRCLKVGLPLIFSSIAILLMESIDRWIISDLLSLEAAGIYSYSYKISTIITILITVPFRQIINPLLNEMEATDASGLLNSLKYRSRQFISLAIFISFLVSILAEDISIIMSPNRDFSNGWQIVPILALGYVFYGLKDLALKPLYFANKYTLISVIYIFSAILNIILNYALIPDYGYSGAAFATSVSYAFMFLIFYMFSRLTVKEVFIDGKVLIILLLTNVGFFLLHLVFDGLLMKALLLITSALVTILVFKFIK